VPQKFSNGTTNLIIIAGFLYFGLIGSFVDFAKKWHPFYGKRA
jgi:hypothetical protein